MRVIPRVESSNDAISCDLKLIELANKKNHPEPSEECFMELTQALSKALEVIQKSLPKQ